MTRGGVVLKKQSGGEGEIEADELMRSVELRGALEAGDAVYVRAECLGRGAAAAWTQPFWLETGEE